RRDSDTQMTATVPGAVRAAPGIASVFVERFDQTKDSVHDRSLAEPFAVAAAAAPVATAQMSTARSVPSLALLPSGKVLVVGGDASAEIFDPPTNTFTATGGMVAARIKPTTAVLGDGRVLVVGGRYIHETIGTTAEIYDPASGTFARTGDLSSD